MVYSLLGQTSLYGPGYNLKEFGEMLFNLFYAMRNNNLQVRAKRYYIFTSSEEKMYPNKAVYVLYNLDKVWQPKTYFVWPI